MIEERKIISRVHHWIEKAVIGVRYSKDAIARKVKQERWQPASAQQRNLLRRALAGSDGN